MSNKTTIYLPEGQQLVVTADASSSGTVYRLADSDGAASEAAYTVAASASITKGPYAGGRKYLIVSEAGQLTYTQTEKLDFLSEERESEEFTTTAGVGASNGATVSAAETGNSVIHKTILTLTATTVTISDDAGVAQYGGVKIYDFPEGLICPMGAVIDGSLTGGVTGTIVADFDGDVALGTATATTGATLTGTEADIMPSVALTQAVTSVANSDAESVATALTESGARWLDGTATAKDLFLNFVIDDDATHTAGTATFTGTVTFIWMNLGDN